MPRTPDEAPHGFVRMEHENYRRWRGHCKCGHKEIWTDNKDWAWEEIADHILHSPGGLMQDILELRARQARAN